MVKRQATGWTQGDWTAPYDVRWAAAHSADTRIIACLAKDERKDARDGALDDTLNHRDLREGAGGTLVHHRNARGMIAALRAIAPEAVPQ